MEKQVIVSIILLIAGILGVGHLIQPVNQSFQGEVADKLREQFEEFQWKYNKVYNDEVEAEMRFANFKHALKFINKFNSEKHSSKVGINQFADLTDVEFRAYLSDLKTEQMKFVEGPRITTSTNRPEKVDWRGSLVWTDVYDQGSCGSCWAFASVQGLEAIYVKITGKSFRQLSVQEILDCAEEKYNNSGCQGGLALQAYDWARDFGVCAVEDYPTKTYQAKVQTCQSDKCTPIIKKGEIKGHVLLPQSNKEKTLDALSNHPITISIDASVYQFRYYTSGIIDTTSFSGTNHAVLVVGYDEKENTYRIKNSWSKTWGEEGYVRVVIQETGKIGTLGMYKRVCYPDF